MRGVSYVFAGTVCVAGLVLGGCGGLQTQSLPASTAASAGAQIVPALTRGDLIYVANFYSGIEAISYPRGKLAGTVNGSDPQGLCPSTTIRGNWWVVNSGTDTVVEYAHGGTSPIATLTVSAGDAVSCAVDPTTGNLAVAIIDANEVVIFKNGSGSGSVIQDPTSSSFFIAYDNKGNLFVDGLNTSSVMLFELRKGANTFKTVTLPHSLAAEFPSELYWDGTYMDMEAQSYGAIAAPQSGAFGSTIYRLAIKHDKAVVEGTVQVTGGGGSFWVGESRLVAFAGNGLNEIGIWKYPAGGTPIKTFPIPNADEPLGLTVSLKPR